jgi:hypothetical protein
MRIRAILLVCVVMAGSFLWSGQKTAAHPDTAGWKDLFNSDLSNALMVSGSWAFGKGVLSAKTEDTLWTRDSYGDFVLDLEFKVTPKANSGVFLRTKDTADILTALEVQIHETTDGSKYGMIGALYDAKPPSSNAAKAIGEWNRYTITCRDSRLALVFNTVEVIRVDLNNWKVAHQNPDGTPNKFAVALKDHARKGPIGLQGLHGAEKQPVYFRNLKIRPL